MLPFVQIFRYIYMFRCIYILFLFLDNILFNYKLIALLVEIVKLFPLSHFIDFLIKRRILGDACFVFVDHYLNVLLQSKSDKKGATVHGFTILFMSFKLLFIRLRKGLFSSVWYIRKSL